MKKLGLTNLDNLKDEEGNLSEDKAVEAIRTHQAEILKQDPSFIDPIKESVSKKLQEEKIVAIKQLKKSFKTIAGLDLTNDQLAEMDADELYKLGFSNKVNNSEISKLQADIIALAQAKEAAENSKAEEVNKIKTFYETQIQSEKIENELMKALSATEFIVDIDTAKILLRSKLANEGISMAYDSDSKKIVFKSGEYEALKADRTGKVDLQYLIERHLSDVTKKSNGSPNGGNTGQTVIDKEKLDRLPAAVRENLARLQGVN